MRLLREKRRSGQILPTPPPPPYIPTLIQDPIRRSIFIPCLTLPPPTSHPPIPNKWKPWIPGQEVAKKAPPPPASIHAATYLKNQTLVPTDLWLKTFTF